MLYEFGNYALDISKRLVTRDGEVLALPPKSFELLLLLLESGGRALSKSELMQALWPDSFVEEANLSFQVSALRKTLGEDGAKWIETLPRHGYRFNAVVKSPACVMQVPKESPPAHLELQPRRNPRRKIWQIAAAGILLISALYLVLSAIRHSPVSTAQDTFSAAIPLTTYAGYQQTPSLSPDGSQVAFSWNGPHSDNYDIYIKLVGPGEPIRLTTDSAIDDWPAWSPNGQLIAFVRYRSEILADIFVVPALGGAEQKVTSVNLQILGRRSASIEGTGNLAWTPDGKWLAFGGVVAGEETPGIWMVALNGLEKRRLTTVFSPNFGDRAPAFTSDGRFLAFIRERTLSDSAVYVEPLSQLSPTGPPQKVSLHANALGLAWKPDGSGLFVSSGSHLGLSRMYSVPFRARMPLDDRDSRLLSFGERARGISVARTGRVVYAAQFRDANMWRLGLLSQDRTAPAPIAASTLDEQTPDYSPDGKWLAFASTRSGVEEIWLANADGSNPKQITFMGGPQCSNPRWSPNSRRILFNSRRDGSADLYLLAPDTGELHKITNHPAEEFEPRWSRNGETIYFGSNRTGRSEVWRMPAAGGEPVQITKHGGSTATESPDSRYLYYSKYDASPAAIWRVPVNGGEEEPVVDGLSYALNFVVAKRGLYFLAVGGSREQTSIDFYEYATKKRTTLANLGKTFWWGMALSPDEKWLLYSVVDNAGSNLMLVDPTR